MADFNLIEKLFSELMAASQPALSESELREIRYFIDVGEYGIALETVVDIFVEEGKIPPAEAIMLVEKLAAAMSIESAQFVERLSIK